ncbi:hypothetical protein KIN20_005724 [Parelaphostrongylus tenuis]|uniref:Uncharacterized protein n=1 Tax=Parelaphostrongylus tenuis TaxID=148309 RepID=A0AAD5MT61_PARTN|nr:hypothetical protein KIN20_005724 [Parelaphostrongylus tenuis]
MRLYERNWEFRASLEQQVIPSGVRTRLAFYRAGDSGRSSIVVRPRCGSSPSSRSSWIIFSGAPLAMKELTWRALIYKMKLMLISQSPE